MPGRDKTGPLSEGPMTGRGFGICNNMDAAPRRFARGGRNRMNHGCGYGFRQGFGQGQGLGRNYDVDNKELLEEEMQTLKMRLDEIEKTLES